MKRLLIVIPSFEVGGTIVSLNSLLVHINPNEIKVDIYSRNMVGPYLDLLPNCNVLPENIWLASNVYYGSLFKKIVFLILKRLRNVLGLIHINLYPIYSYIGGKMIKSDSYDTVISYQEDLNRVVCYYPAKKRIAWIHAEYQRYLKLIGRNDEYKFYNKFDKIVCVSNFARKSFLEVFPEFDSKTDFIYNIINKSYIMQRADENILWDPAFDNSKFTIISVGRLDKVKQFDLIPSIARRLIDQYDDDFIWYIIGGPEGSKIWSKIKKEIKTQGLTEIVKCLGEKPNVYPYIKASNLLVHTSMSESFSLVVHEARALSVPSVLNDIEVAKEVINNEMDGVIAGIEEMPEVIHKAINGGYKFRYESIPPSKSIEKFYSIL